MRYYKIDRTTVTGQKFNGIDKRLIHCHDKAVGLIEEMLVDGVEIVNYRLADNCVSGGIGSVFIDGFTPSYMKRVKGTRNEYLPSPKTTQGRLLDKKIKELPVVTISDLNSCIDIPVDAMIGSIGYNSTNPQYALILIYKKWNITPPSECIEIEETEFTSMKQNIECEMIKVE